MRVGSLVESQHDWEEERKAWNVAYPNKGDIFTVIDMEKHHKYNMMMLYLQEFTGGFPLAEKSYNGKRTNFVEVQPPMNIDIDEILKEPVHSFELQEL